MLATVIVPPLSHLSGSYCGDGTPDFDQGEECDDGGESNACNTNCTIKSENSFVSTWETTGHNETITIPTTGGGYSYIINWGDQNDDSDDGQSTAENPSHTYSQPEHIRSPSLVPFRESISTMVVIS